MPGERPRVLYWYRTAPEVLIGRPALDEEAIRTIEEQHPADRIRLAGHPRPARSDAARGGAGASTSASAGTSGSARGWASATPGRAARRTVGPAAAEPEEVAEVETATAEAMFEPFAEPEVATTRGLLEELVGREIATRLRARHAEVMARMHQQGFDEETLATWVTRAEALDPDTWLTPDAVLAGVRDADARFEELRRALLEAPRGAD